MGTFAKQYAESMAQVSGHIAMIADRDQFIAVSGGMKNVLGKSISRDLEEKINNRESVVASRIRSVLRISFGITIRPRSSILLTIPVAFI